MPEMASVYLDNNATTPVDPRVFEAMSPYFVQEFGNASSVHQFGQKARAAVEGARGQVASLLMADPREVVFTSGGTESDNSAIRGAVYACNRPGAHLITTKIEHPAVLRTCEALEREGYSVTYLDVDEEGVVSVEDFTEALTDRTVLASVMYANNETGAIQPLPEISERAKQAGVLVHSDAVQAIGKIPVDLTELPVDLLSLTGHKFHGPKGVGALFIRKGCPFNPMMLGGSHERSRRGGTENVSGIVGLGMACEIAREELTSFIQNASRLRDLLESELLKSIPRTWVNGPAGNRVPHVSNLSFENTEGESLLVALDFEGIAVSTGAACTSGSMTASHVLTAMGLPPERIQGAIRFSLSRFTTETEIRHVAKTVSDAVGRIRSVSSGVR